MDAKLIEQLSTVLTRDPAQQVTVDLISDTVKHPEMQTIAN